MEIQQGIWVGTLFEKQGKCNGYQNRTQGLFLRPRKSIDSGLNGFNDGLENCTKKMLLVRNSIKIDSCMILDHQPDLVVLCKQNRTAIINQLTHFLSNENIPFVDMRTGTQLIKF